MTGSQICAVAQAPIAVGKFRGSTFDSLCQRVMILSLHRSFNYNDALIGLKK